MIPEEPKAPNDVSNQFEGPAGGTGHPLIDQGRDARKSNGSEPDANGAVGLPRLVNREEQSGEQQDSRPAGPSIPEEPKAASQKEGLEVEALDSLEAVIRESDRNTDAYIAARAVLRKAGRR